MTRDEVTRLPGDSGALPDGLVLVRREGRLELRVAGEARGRPIYVDFSAGPMAARRRFTGSRRQPIARAVGIRGEPPTVLDATAGLGRDAFLLACLGCRVVAVERSPILAALVRDGLARATQVQDARLQAVLGRLSLVEADSREYMLRLSDADRPDVIYLDPMYPARTKSALGKKEFRVLGRLVGDDPDARELLDIARSVARKRVVVKRPRHAPPLAPSRAVQYESTRIRYDAYLFRT